MDRDLLLALSGKPSNPGPPLPPKPDTPTGISLSQPFAARIELIKDGNFDLGCGVHWICGSGWSIDVNTAFSTGETSNLSQNIDLEDDADHLLKFTLEGTFIGDGLKVMLGSSDLESTFFANNNGIHVVILKAGNSFDKLRFRNTDLHKFTGVMKNVSLTKI